MSFIEVEAPDGTIVEFPADTPRDVMRSAMQRRFGGPEAEEAAPGPVQRFTNFMYRAGDMVPGGDEIRSAAMAGTELVGDILTGEETPGGISGAWQRAREEDRAASEYANRHITPVEQVAADTLGLGTSMIAPLRIAQATGLTAPIAQSAAGRIGQAATLGGVSGGIVGLTEGETLEERAQNSGVGTVIGAGLGAGLSGVAEGVGGLLRTASRVRPATDANARQRALERVARRMDFDDTTPAQASDQLAEMRRAGVEPTIMESGPNMRGLARSVRDQPGQGAARIDEVVENRSQDIARAMRSRVDEALLPGGLRYLQPDDGQNAIRDGIRRFSAPLYQQVTGTVPLTNQTLRHVLTRPSTQRAYREATRMAADDGFRMPRIYDEAGELINGVDGIDVRALHYVRRALDDIGDMANREGATNRTVGPRQLRGLLDRVMKAHSPSLEQADGVHSLLMGGFDGVQVGREFDRMSADQLRTWMRQATATQRFMARMMAAHRYGGRIQDMADPTRTVREGSNRLESLRAIFGDQQAADDFARHVAAQREIAATRQVVSGGSMTSRNQATIDFDDAGALVEIGADMTTSGGLLSALRQSAARLMRRLPGTMSEAERGALVDILTETNPERLRAIFEALEGMTQATSIRGTTQGLIQNTTSAITAQEAARALD